MTRFGLSPAAVAADFHAFGWFYFSVGAVALGAAALRWREVRLWLLPALAVLFLFVETRTVAYGIAFYGVDHPDWSSFYGSYLNDPNATPSLVLYTTKLGLGLTARAAEFVLSRIGLPLSDPAFMISGRFSGIGFDMLVSALMIVFAGALLPRGWRPGLALVLAACFALVPAHLFIATTISYNLIGDFCLLLALAADFACVLTLSEVCAAIRSGPTDQQRLASLLLRLGLAVAAYAVAVVLILGAKWLLPPLAAVFAAQTIGLAVSEVRLQGSSGGRRLALLAIAWTAVAMVACSLAGYFLVVFPRAIGSPDFFARNFWFFAAAALQSSTTSASIVHVGRFFHALVFDLLIPNVGTVAVVLAPIGFVAAVVTDLRRRAGLLLLGHLAAMIIFLQSLFAVFATVEPAAMPRNTLLMFVVLLYAVVASAHAGRLAAMVRPAGRVAGILLALAVLADCGFNGAGYLALGGEQSAGVRFAEEVARLPPAAGLAGMAAGSSSCWLSPPDASPRLRRVEGVDRVTGAIDAADLQSGYWVLSSCDTAVSSAAPRMWPGMRRALSAAGYVEVARFEPPALALPRQLAGIVRARQDRLILQPQRFGLFQPGFFELWQRHPANVGTD